MARREPRPSQVTPHPFVLDAFIPHDAEGRAYCEICGLPGELGDARHPLPDPAAQAQHRTRVGDRQEEDR